MSKDLDTTYYRFMSEVRAFLSKLLKNPVDAQPSKYLKDRDFTRKKLINELLSRDVLERHEKILDRTNSDEKDAKYVVKFKVHKKDFEKRIHRIYSKYFEKNVNESVFADEEEMKNKILNGPDGETYRKRGGINEEGEGGGIGAAAPAGEAPAGDSGAGSDTDEKADGGRGQFNTPVFPMQRRSIYAGAQGDIITKNPILGKTVTAESKKSRRVFVTEEQLQKIFEEEGLGAGGATTTTSVASETTRGDLGYDVPFLGNRKGGSGKKFMEPAMERKPGFSVERIGEKKKK